MPTRLDDRAFTAIELYDRAAIATLLGDVARTRLQVGDIQWLAEGIVLTGRLDTVGWFIAAIAVGREMTAEMAQLVEVLGSVRVERLLAAQGYAVASVGGALLVVRALGGAAGVAAAVGGDVELRRGLSAYVETMSVMDGLVAIQRHLAANLVSSVLVESALGVTRLLAASAAVTASLSGTIRAGRNLAAEIGTHVSLTGLLEVASLLLFAAEPQRWGWDPPPPGWPLDPSHGLAQGLEVALTYGGASCWQFIPNVGAATWGNTRWGYSGAGAHGWAGYSNAPRVKRNIYHTSQHYAGAIDTGLRTEGNPGADYFKQPVTYAYVGIRTDVSQIFFTAQAAAGGAGISYYCWGATTTANVAIENRPDGTVAYWGPGVWPQAWGSLVYVVRTRYTTAPTLIQDIFINHKKFTTNAGTISTIHATRGIGWGNGGAWPNYNWYPEPRHGDFLWRRALSDAEIHRLVERPFDHFIPR